MKKVLREQYKVNANRIQSSGCHRVYCSAGSPLSAILIIELV